MAWNAFRFCSGLRVLGYVMILLVAALIGVTYYALVITTYGPHLFKGGSDFFGALVVIVLFHALLIMLIWCYSMVVFTDPGSVPLNWRPMTDEDDVEAQPLPNTSDFQPIEDSKPCEEMLGSTFCRKCQNHKPPRCHHCRVCQKCILKMDHHCVWVVNCVGAHNYKFFLLFLVYTFLATTMAVLALLPYFIDFFKDVQKHDGSPSALATTFLAFILNVAFSLSLLGFLIMHSSLLLSNTTTIEVYEKKKSEKWKYDMGRKENFEQVFGKNKGYWLIPLYSEKDKMSLPVLHGFDYPIRSDLES